MKNKILTALLVTAVVMVAACGSSAPPQSATPTPKTHPSVTPIPKPAGKITEFSQQFFSPSEITAGPDGNLWFTESLSKVVGQITTAGVITEFPLSKTNGWDEAITAGPDGNLWFTECVPASSGYGCSNGHIGRITTGGVVTGEFPIPSASSQARGITAGPDGNLWFTECVSDSSGFGCNSGQIGRITPTGQFTEFPLPDPTSGPRSITAGPDGNLWFTECVPTDPVGCYNGQIGRITPSGRITEFPLPNPDNEPWGITAGPDGNLWFTDAEGNRIGRITPSGSIKEFALPTDCGDSAFGCRPEGITRGPDGNLWFTEANGNRIGRITPSGRIKEFVLPACSNGVCNPEGITRGPDGNLWFTECFNPYDGVCIGSIGRITSGK